MQRIETHDRTDGARNGDLIDRFVDHLIAGHSRAKHQPEHLVGRLGAEVVLTFLFEMENL